MPKSIALCAVLVFYSIALRSQDPVVDFIESELTTFPDCEVAVGLINGSRSLNLGFQIVGGEVSPVDNETALFEIASISKVFTAALLAKEIAKGTISLEHRLQDHLDFKIKSDVYEDHVLRMKHLVSHTSGLKRNPLMSYPKYEGYLKRFELDYVPGQNWEYNNLTIGLLAKIVAQKNGTPWPKMLKDELLQPLAMHNTYAHLGEAPEANRVQCLDKKGKSRDCYFHKNGAFQWPSGGMISNLADMMKWLRANLDDTDTPLTFLPIAHEPLEDSVDMAWFTKYQAQQGLIWWHYRSGRGDRIICHGGNSPAQTSFMAFDKPNQKGVVILANIDGRSLMNAEQIMKTTELAMKLFVRGED